MKNSAVVPKRASPRIIWSPQRISRDGSGIDRGKEDPHTGDHQRRSKVADADLVVIDEVSMVGEQMGRDLLSFGTKVLVLGDAQSPPIEDGGFLHEEQTRLPEAHSCPSAICTSLSTSHAPITSSTDG